MSFKIDLGGIGLLRVEVDGVADMQGVVLGQRDGLRGLVGGTCFLAGLVKFQVAASGATGLQEILGKVVFFGT